MEGQISAVGIPWYARQDYQRIREIMVDANALPDTYDQWLKAAEYVEGQIKASESLAVRAYIDPETFPAWCRAHSLKRDAHARQMFGAEFAHGPH